MYLLFVSLAAHSPPTQEVRSDQPRFALRVPSGYLLVKEELPSNRFFMKEEDGVRFVLTVSVLSAMIREGEVADREESLRDEAGRTFPGNPEIRSHVRRAAWKGHSIELLELRFKREDAPMLAVMAFVPVFSKGVRLEVLGPEQRESQIHADLQETLFSMEAMASWIHPGQRQWMIIVPLPSVASLIGIPVYIGVWLFFFRRKPMRLFHMRVAFMAAMGGLALLPPLLWASYLKDVPVPPPGVCTWPLALFLSALWLIPGSAKLIASLGLKRQTPSPQT